MTRVLGLDPAWRNTGWSVLEIMDNFNSVADIGTIKTPNPDIPLEDYKNLNEKNDIIHIIKSVDKLLDKIQPDILCTEIPMGAQSASGMKMYAFTIAVLSYLAQEYPELPTYYVQPKWVKVDTVGQEAAKEAKGTQIKDIMIAYATRRYQDAKWPRRKSGEILKGKSEHIADSFCIIESGLKRNDDDLYKTLCNNIRSEKD